MVNTVLRRERRLARRGRKASKGVEWGEPMSVSEMV